MGYAINSFSYTNHFNTEPIRFFYVHLIYSFRSKIDISKLSDRSKILVESIRARQLVTRRTIIFRSLVPREISHLTATGDKNKLHCKLELLVKFSYGRVKLFILCKYISKVCHLLFAGCHSGREFFVLHYKRDLLCRNIKELKK